MSSDKFSRKRRTDAGTAPGAPEYDFSRIAQDAVSNMKAQQEQADPWGGEPAMDFSPRTFDDKPGSRRKDVFAGRKPKQDAPWDRPADPDNALGEAAEARRRRSFGFGRKDNNTQSGDWDQPRDRASIEGESSRERKAFGFGRKKADAQPDQWDQPRNRADVEAEPQRERKVFGFGRKKSDAQPDQWDQTRDRADVEAEPQRERRAFGFGRKKADDQPDQWDQPRDRASIEEEPRGRLRRSPRRSPESISAAQDDPFPADDRSVPAATLPEPDIFDDFDDDILSFDEPAEPAAPAPPPAPPAPVSGQPERRVFNAATQPNYSYMTDYPEEQPAAPSRETDTALSGSAPAAGSTAGGMVDSVRSAILRKLNRDEPGVQYYTPPANRAPSDVRRRQKRRNRKPLAPWVKYVLFGIGLTAAFVLIFSAAFYFIITGRINYVGDSFRNPVYLSVEEYANLKADLTDTEENAAEFTEPMNILEPDEDIKVIMLVSSDSRIGDVYGENGRKKTNNSAKADSIMLVAIDNTNRRLRVASIMTDTYVRIQDYKTNKLSKAYYYDTANGDYTLPCLRQAVRDNFGVTPDNYVVVDFSAFQILINRLGGIDIEVSADEAYYMSNHKRYGDFPRFNSAGNYTMSGAEALNYARMRAVGNDDYDRSARQRIVLNKILGKLKDMSTLELAELAYALLPELPTDMTAGQLFNYLIDAADIASYEVNEVTFPITNSWRYGTASVRPDDASLQNPYEDEPVSGSDVTSGSDVGASLPAPTLNKFTVIVTNFQFNSTVLQKYLYENDDSYLNGTAASGITVPEIIAPLEADSPAAGLLQPAG